MQIYESFNNKFLTYKNLEEKLSIMNENFINKERCNDYDPQKFMKNPNIEENFENRKHALTKFKKSTHARSNSHIHNNKIPTANSNNKIEINYNSNKNNFNKVSVNSNVHNNQRINQQIETPMGDSITNTIKNNTNEFSQIFSEIFCLNNTNNNQNQVNSNSRKYPVFNNIDFFQNMNTNTINNLKNHNQFNYLINQNTKNSNITEYNSQPNSYQGFYGPNNNSNQLNKNNFESPILQKNNMQNNNKFSQGNNEQFYIERDTVILDSNFNKSGNNYSDKVVRPSYPTLDSVLNDGHDEFNFPQVNYDRHKQNNTYFDINKLELINNNHTDNNQKENILTERSVSHNKILFNKKEDFEKILKNNNHISPKKNCVVKINKEVDPFEGFY